MLSLSKHEGRLGAFALRQAQGEGAIKRPLAPPPTPPPEGEGSCCARPAPSPLVGEGWGGGPQGKASDHAFSVSSTSLAQ